MKKIFKLGLTSILSLAFISACGRGHISGKDGFYPESVDAQEGLFNFASWKQGKDGKDFLNLTEDQKIKLKALKDDMKTKFEKDINNKTAIKDAIKNSFLANKMNIEELKSKIETLKPNKEAHQTAMAESILKGYEILTVDQRKLLEDKRLEMEKRMDEMKDKFNPADKILDIASKKLNLTEDQKTKLKVIIEESKPDFEAMRTKRKNVAKSLSTELNSGKATIDSIKNILKNNAPEDQLTKHIDKLLKVHDLLSADQRKEASELFDKFGKGGHGFRGHGKHRGGFGHFGKGGHCSNDSMGIF
jgi:Spy/CpxP family protein refolding chaperone